MKEFVTPSEAMFRKFRCEMDHSRQTEGVVLPTAIQSVTRPARFILVAVARYVLIGGIGGIGLQERSNTDGVEMIQRMLWRRLHTIYR
jgi:hypothetical protein